MPNPEASPEPTAQVMAIGMAVRLVQAPSYLKTAESMPMLRPPDLVDTTELGQVVGLRAGGLLAVRFRRGTFLLDAAQLERVKPEG